MTIQDVRNDLIKDLESEYTPSQIRFIDDRLEAISIKYGISLDWLDYYCCVNSSEMFTCIFNYKEFDKSNFEID